MREVFLRRWAWVTHPQEAVQFPHGHLLGSVHSLENLLLMLRVEGTLSGLPWALAQAVSVCLSLYDSIVVSLSVCVCLSLFLFVSVSLHMRGRGGYWLSSILFRGRVSQPRVPSIPGTGCHAGCWGFELSFHACVASSLLAELPSWPLLWLFSVS